jgi:hypothetical protein
MLGTLPSAEFFAKRLGVDVPQAQAWLDQLTQEGTLGRLPTGDLAVKPPAPDLSAPAGAITPAQEAAARLANEGAPQLLPDVGAAPDFPHVATRQAGLAGLSPDEIDTLVNTAYPVPEAQANAILKYADPQDLASRAVERITAQRGLVEQLAQRDPALARKIALLPEPAGAALPDLGQVPDVPTAAPAAGVVGSTPMGAEDFAGYQTRVPDLPQRAPGEYVLYTGRGAGDLRAHPGRPAFLTSDPAAAAWYANPEDARPEGMVHIVTATAKRVATEADMLRAAQRLGVDEAAANTAKEAATPCSASWSGKDSRRWRPSTRG